MVEFPDIAQLYNTFIYKSSQAHTRTFSSHRIPTGSLLLAPELFVFPLFEVIKVAVFALLSGFLRLPQPFGVVAAVLEIELELSNAVAPVV